MAGAVEPAYADPGSTPRIDSWTDISLSLGGACPEILNGRAYLVVALSSRFTHTGTLNDLAARVGQVSDLEGLKYWSVTDGAWRTLISQSHAVQSLGSRQPRSDFSAREVLSGQPLFMVQRDTRSTGPNLYSLQATAPSDHQLTVSIVNQSNIRFLVATMFERENLVSAHFFTRLRGNEWGYYSLTVVKQNVRRGREASYINRAVSYKRFITGQQPDGTPPVAR
ncbi:DUF6675 family protein [Pseudaestuariivita rosea]|uniref:DUF6675 family protein n=1 Tax=Pseudaestuariivita rosea TaxID=2763263 RepID=UPI001ABAF8F8|nr:DUF6675 family protein [Pseudaestuariivita rosea]